jgi:hypothetical protein
VRTLALARRAPTRPARAARASQHICTRAPPPKTNAKKRGDQSAALATRARAASASSQCLASPARFGTPEHSRAARRARKCAVARARMGLTRRCLFVDARFSRAPFSLRAYHHARSQAKWALLLDDDLMDVVGEARFGAALERAQVRTRARASCAARALFRASLARTLLRAFVFCTRKAPEWHAR